MATVVRVSEPAASQYTELDLSARLNDREIQGDYEGFYDADTNVHGGVIKFDDDPALGSVVLRASFGSWVSWNKCVYLHAKDGAVNLTSVMGFPFDVEVDYSMVRPDGTEIGRFQQIGHLEEVSPGRLQGHSRIEGWFEGPAEVEWSPGYAQYLRQAAQGRIESVYGQTIINEGGERFHSAVRRAYLYEGDRELPFDEVWSYKMLSAVLTRKSGLRFFDYRATAQYTPASFIATSDIDESIAFADRNFVAMKAGVLAKHPR
ncbi:MAG: hypothetical protein OXG65_16865 [Chloroflexi bacterium]|nr:hypothetical protein [Chloroflexota bacterium]